MARFRIRARSFFILSHYYKVEATSVSQCETWSVSSCCNMMVRVPPDYKSSNPQPYLKFTVWELKRISNPVGWYKHILDDMTLMIIVSDCITLHQEFLQHMKFWLFEINRLPLCGGHDPWIEQTTEKLYGYCHWLYKSIWPAYYSKASYVYA